MSNHLNKLAAEFNRYFTSSNGVDVPTKVSVPRDEWRALFTAIQQAEAKTDESVAWLDEMLADTKEVFDANGNETPQVVRDVIEYVASWIAVYNEKRHPAPGVSDDVARNAIATVREQYRGTDWGKAAECICDAIDAAMLAAAQAKKETP